MRRARKTNAPPSGEVRGVDGGRNVVAARRSRYATSARAGRPRPAHHVARRDRVRRELAPAPEGARRRRARRGCPGACAARVTQPHGPQRGGADDPVGPRSWARCHRATAPGACPTSSRIARIARRGRGAVGVPRRGQAHRPARRLVEPQHVAPTVCPSPGGGAPAGAAGHELGRTMPRRARRPHCAREVSIRPARVRHRISPRGLVRG